MAMQTRYKYIEFIEEHVGGKTRKFFCRNHETGAWLGEVKWAGNWRCYGWFPNPGTMYEHQCQFDIGHFLKQLTDEWREKKKAEKAAQG